LSISVFDAIECEIESTRDNWDENGCILQVSGIVLVYAEYIGANWYSDNSAVVGSSGLEIAVFDRLDLIDRSTSPAGAVSLNNPLRI
jgi:hypothetical protein